MNILPFFRRATLVVATAASAALLGGCPSLTTPSTDGTFVSISEHGFDKADNARDLNNYPWSMAFFTPDDQQDPNGGNLYVGTGNSIINIAAARFGVDMGVDPLFRPPEIRRYRPDLGPKHWERVLDYRDVETGPQWQTSGFRGMAVYRAASDGVKYLYAGTFGNRPALWRSATGDAGSWEQVWESPLEGSIRSLTIHDGLLYFAVSHESGVERFPGEIYATDGATFRAVVTDGFGNPHNWGIFSLASYNGYLYAGTFNREDGYELWKLEGPDAGAAPVLVIEHGGPEKSNHSTTQMVVFDDYLYVPALVYVGYNVGGVPIFKGGDMVRLDHDDRMEVIVGPGSLAGIGSGFDDNSNAYLWTLIKHNGKLYCGTWDSNAEISILLRNWPVLLRNIPNIVKGLLRLKARPGPIDQLAGIGAELYVSEDGIHWKQLFHDGLGNPDNYGVRNMESHDGTLYVGMANPVDGLEVFEMVEQP